MTGSMLGSWPSSCAANIYGVDGLGQFGSFERILPILEARQKLFIETFGAAPTLPEPSAEGRPGIIPPLVAAHARVILPDLRGFGASAKSISGIITPNLTLRYVVRADFSTFIRASCPVKCAKKA